MPNKPIRSKGSGILASGSRHVTLIFSVDCPIASILVTVTDNMVIFPFAVSEVIRGAFARS